MSRLRDSRRFQTDPAPTLSKLGQGKIFNRVQAGFRIRIRMKMCLRDGPEFHLHVETDYEEIISKIGI